MHIQLSTRPGVRSSAIGAEEGELWLFERVTRPAGRSRGRTFFDHDTPRCFPRDPAHWRDAWQHEHTLGKYVISDKPMTEEEWTRERAPLIDVTPENEKKS